MPELPLISIGIPVYNGEGTIGSCLEAVLGQTYPNLEVIISDNGSTDGTEAICRRVCQADKRIRFFRQDSNQGIVANFKFVFRKAQGRFFFWAAADDHWDARFIEKLHAAHSQAPGSSVAHCSVRRNYPDGTLHDVIRFSGQDGLARHNTLRLLYLLLSSRTPVRDKKFNLFVNGLFSREAAAEAVESYDFLSGDRPFVAALALRGRFVSIPDILMTKTIYPPQSRVVDATDDFYASTEEDKLSYYLKIFPMYFGLRGVPLRHKLFTLPLMGLVLLRERKVRNGVLRRLGLKR